MKTIPIAKPGTGPAPTPNASVISQQEARARAIAKFSGEPTQAPQQHAQSPIPTNPNQVSVEELGSVQSLQSNTVEEQVEQEVTTEEVREVSKPAEVREEPPSNSQLAILARKERALRAKAQQQEAQIKSERDSWQQEKQAMEKRLQELESGYIPKSSLKQAALEAMSKGEISYDEFTHEMMNPIDSRVTSTIQKLEAQVADLRGKLDASAKSYEDNQTASYQAAIKQIELDVKGLVKTDPSFEAIRFTRSERDVVELIEQTYKEEGYVMTVEEAAQQVEDYLVDEASKLAKLSKIQKRLSPPAPVVKKAEVQDQTQTPNQSKQPQPMKTLTNTNSGSRKLSSRERALLAFKGELKS